MITSKFSLILALILANEPSVFGSNSSASTQDLKSIYAERFSSKVREIRCGTVKAELYNKILNDSQCSKQQFGVTDPYARTCDAAADRLTTYFSDGSLKTSSGTSLCPAPKGFIGTFNQAYSLSQQTKVETAFKFTYKYAFLNNTNLAGFSQDTYNKRPSNQTIIDALSQVTKNLTAEILNRGSISINSGKQFNLCNKGDMKCAELMAKQAQDAFGQ